MLVNTSESLGQTVGVLDALHCGAVLIGPAGVIVHANERLCRMMRRPLDELLGRYLWEFYPPEETQRLQDEFHREANDEVEKETTLPCAGGEPLPVIISSRPLDHAAPRAGHRILTIIDISQQKRVEKRFQQQYQEVAKLSDTVLEQALDLKHYSRSLEEKVRERTAELHEANMDAILMLAVACEARDSDTGAHVLRIKEYARILAQELGLSESESEEIAFSAIMHDVGKIQVPDEILKKPGPLTTGERQAMEFHTIAGERILSKRPFFDTARLIARYHHENWDGSGYPDRLASEDIPLPARIVHLVDVFDALTFARVYKSAWQQSDTITEITRLSGTMFDPHLAEVFRALLDAGAFEEIISLRDSPGTFDNI